MRTALLPAAPLAVLLGIALGALALSPPLRAADAPLPAPDSPQFCSMVQQFTAGTRLTGSNTLFKDMVAYRKSKPFAKPHTTFQVVSYQGKLPVVVSCKVKTSANLRAVYGEQSVGPQRYCYDLTTRIRDQAAADLRLAGNAAAAARAAGFRIDRTEPYSTGQQYLQDFTPAYAGPDGVHLASPSLFQDYDAWYSAILPERVVGQLYCHLPTVAFVKALATGAAKPGLVITTGDNAVVVPR
jgi:hypothetical protein